MKIKLAQLKLVTGDIEGNFAKIRSVLVDSVNREDCDVIVYPETAISGYCCGALWDRQEFILEQQGKIYQLATLVPPELCVIIGFVSYHGMRKNGLPRLRNSVAVINDGRVQVYDKQLLANTGHHEDRKYFEEGTKTEVFKIRLKCGEYTIGTPICEDCWSRDHTRNIPKEMKELGAQILFSTNQSYFYYGKNTVRKNLFSNHAYLLEIPVVAVNAVGLGDIGKNILIYDGSSLHINNKGWVVNRLSAFSEEICVVEEYFRGRPAGNIQPILSKYEEITDALIFAAKEMYALSGIKKAQIHISGGLDSAICAALITKALGEENVIAITNPSDCNTPNIYANGVHTANELGLKLQKHHIQEIYEKILEVDARTFGDKLTPAAKSCIQATLRTCLGLYNSHRFGTALISTTNHTELCLGFSSYLDISYAGIMALIADLSKTECYQIARHLNENVFGREVIPKGLYDGSCKASAELPDNQGPDPIDYFIQSGVCCEIIRKNKSRKQLIRDFKEQNLTSDYFPTLEVYGNKSIYDYCTVEKFAEEVDKAFKGFKRSVYKTEQCPPVPLISPYNRGFSKRETLINKYNY